MVAMRSTSPVTRPALLAVVFGVACGAGSTSKKPDEAQAGRSCRVSLKQRGAAEHLPEVKADELPASHIVTNVELKLARLQSELEAKIDRRLAAKTGVSAGVAGAVDYTVDRGPLALSVEREALLVQSEVRAHAQVCARGRCYASCDPTALVQVRVPLQLSPTYRFAPSRVTANFTRGCKIRALGGFLTIDITPTLEAQLAPELERVARQIDGKLPDLRPQAERAWSELGKKRSLPLGGCVLVQPSGIVQGPVQGSRDAILLRFALLARPELRSQCAHEPGEPDEPAPQPLPPLARDPALPADDDVALGLVMPLSGVASAFRASAPSAAGQRMTVPIASVASAGAALDAELTLGGDVCGDLALRATPAWNSDGRSLGLVAPELSPSEAERVDASSIDRRALLSALAAAPKVTPPIAVDAIDDVIPILAKAASDDSVDVSARAEPARPLRARARGADLVAWVTLRGSVALKQK